MRVVLILLAGAWLAACTPSLNWRELTPPGAGLVASFPCRPDFGERPASAEGPAMGLARCDAAGMGFSLSWAELPGAAQVAVALREMPRSLAGKLGGVAPTRAELRVAGMTPQADAGQFLWHGPKGAVTRMAVFAHGTRVYQALLRGPRDDAAAWGAFIDGLRFGR